MATPSAFTPGDLVARVEAPTVLYRVSEKLPRGFVRILPFQRSGRELFLISVGRGARMIWAGDGSQWTKVGAT